MPPDAGAASAAPAGSASLRRSLLRALALPILIALLTGGTFAYLIAEQVVSRAYDQSLLNLAKGIADRVVVEHGEIRLALTREAEEVLRTDTDDRIYFRVRNDHGRIIAGDADLPPPEPPAPISELPLSDSQHADLRALTLPERQYFYETKHRGEAIRGVRLHPLAGKEGFYVTVAETLNKRHAAVRDLLLGLGLAMIFVLIAAGAVVRFGVTAGLASLQRLERQLAERSGNDLSPVDPHSVPLEVREVVRALNAMLARLREADAAQREFVQDAAHQLRTPLAGLRMQIELLDRQPGDPATLARLRHAVDRVTRLANQLLALARAESGEHLRAAPVRVDLAELIDDMLDDWLRRADARGIDFGVQREPLRIDGDPVLLRELIANLVDNALKYTPAGGQVTLRCERSATCSSAPPAQGTPAEAGEQIEIEVSDDGPGIPESERERVFERFYRVPGAPATGSGLGLPIARGIVAAHGGRIVIADGGKCAGGGGTRVRVTLPARQGAGGAAAEASPTPDQA